MPDEKKSKIDLDAYKKAVGGEESAPEVPKPFIDKDAYSEAIAGTHTGQTSKEQEVDLSEYTPYIKNVYADQDINKKRAISQDLGDELLNFNSKVLPKIGLDVVGTVANILDVENVAGMMGMIDTDYRNWLTDLTNQGKEAMDELNPVYEMEPNKLFDPSDSAWWINNIGSVAESAASFAVTGFGVGGMLGKGVTALRMANAIRAAKGLEQGSQLLNALALTHAEGVLTGAEVYQRVLEETGTPQLAAEAASHAVRLNYINVALNYTSLTPLMRGMGTTRNLIDGKLQRLAGETLEEFQKRTAGKVSSLGRTAKNAFLKEAPQEAAEEGINYIAQQEGLHKANLAGQQGMSFFERTVANLSSPEGLLSMGLGAFGGMANTAAIAGISKLGGSTKRLEQEYHRQRQSLIDTYGEFEGTKLADKIQKTREINSKLEQAALKSDTVELKNAQDDLFFVQMNEAFESGTVDALEQRLSAIQQMKPEEAIAQGIASSVNDTEYKRFATERIQQLKENEELYNQVKTNFYNIPKPEGVEDNDFGIYRNRIQGEIFHNQFKLNEIGKLIRQEESKKIQQEFNNPDENSNFLLKTINTTLGKLQQEKQTLIKQFEQLTSPKKQKEAIKEMAERDQQLKAEAVKRAEEEKRELEDERKAKEIKAAQERVAKEKAKPVEKKPTFTKGDLVNVVNHEGVELGNGVELKEISEDGKFAKTTLGDGFIPVEWISKSTISEQVVNANPKVKKFENGKVADLNERVSELNEAVEDSVSKPVDVNVSDNINTDTTGRHVSIGDKKFDGLTLAYLSNEYDVQEWYNMLTKKDKLDEEGNIIQNQNLDKRLLSSNYFQPGDKVELFIDKDNKDYEVNKNNPELVPIGIRIFGESKAAAYVHRLDWINENNIAQDRSGQNVSNQRRLVKSLRELVFNAGSPVATTVTYKSLGKLNLGPEFKPATNLGNEVEILIGKDETFQNDNFNRELVNKQPAINGAVYLAIPTPVKDKYIAVFPRVNKISEDDAEIILKSIELFDKAQNNELSEEDKEMLDDLALNGVQFNLRTKKDLEDFISTLVYHGSSTIDPDKNQVQALHIDVPTRKLKLGIESNLHFSWDEFNEKRDDIKMLLTTKYRAISLNDINVNKENHYYPSLENGKIVSKKADTYKDFALSLLTTNIQPQQRFNSDGSLAETTYFSQPIIGFNGDLEAETTLAQAEIALVGEDFVDTKSPITGDTGEGLYDEEGYLEEEEDANPNFKKVDSDYVSLSEFFIAKDFFNAYQQNEIINTFVNAVLSKIQNDPKTTKSQAFEEIRAEFKNLYNKFKYYSEVVPGSEQDEKKAKGVFRTLDANKKRADKLKAVLDHIQKFEKFAEYKLKTLGVTLSEDGEFEQASADASSNSFDDSRSFSSSSKEQASAEIRGIFNFIPELELKNGEIIPKRNFLGFSTYLPFDQVWDDTMRAVSGATSLDEMFAILEELGINNRPEFKSVADKIRSSSTKIQAEFFSTFSKQHNHFVTLLRTSGDKGAVLRPISTNRQNAERVIEAEWIENLKNSEVVVYTPSGELAIDSEKAAKVYEEYKAWVSEKDFDKEKLQDLSKILSKIGIDISLDALEYARKYPKYVNKKTADFITLINGSNTGAIKLIFDRLTKKEKATNEDESLFELNNPFVSESSSIHLLASLELRFRKSLFTASFKDGEGKTIYSFSNNTYLSHKMKALSTNDEYAKKLFGTAFASTSSWLKQLTKGNLAFANVFGLEYIDTIKQMYNPSAVGSKLRNASEREFELIRLGLFQNQGKGDKSNNFTSKFLYLTPSDKTTMPVITALKQNVTALRRNGTLVFNQETIDAVYAVVEAEIKRIQQTKQQLEDPSFDKKQYIEEYHTGIKAGLKFHWFPQLNSLPELFDPTGLPRTIGEVEVKLIKSKLNEYLNELIEDKKEDWKSMELFQIKEDGSYDFTHFDKSYITKAVKGNSDSERLDFMAADFVINTLIANANISQIFSGDPALHGKKDSRGNHVKETLINMSKRNAKDGAPGLDGNFKDTHFKTVYLSDLKDEIADKQFYIDHLTKLIGRHEAAKLMDAYSDINLTDAQEWTTVTEHLDVMEAYGRITSEERQKLEARLSKGEATETDLKYVLQPMKPVYVEQVIENNIAKMVYIKTSSFPLIPQLTKGQELDKLRLAMEGKTGNDIQRAVVKSGVKLGAQNIQKFDFDNLNLKENYILLPRTGFRIQQEVPFDPNKDHIVEVTQARKLIVSEIDNSTQFTLPEDSTLLPATEGDHEKTISGGDLKQKFQELHREVIQRGFNDLLKRIGGKHNEDGTLTIESFEKLKDILVQEAQDRGYPINDILSLELSQDPLTKEVKFDLPLWASPNASKFEALLNSLITNAVIRLKLPGKSYVQGSPAGIKNLKTSSKLKFLRPENGKIEHAECMIAWPFKGVDMKKYVNEDGTPKANFPKELLQVIGNRIPNQGLNSMLPLKIVGFLPEEAGDLVIVPDAVTVQMGSDFDVDKLFVYIYNYEVNEEGDLTKVRMTEESLGKQSKAAIENGIIDIHKTILTHPDNLNRVLEPLGFGPLNAVAKDVDRIRNKGKKQFTYLYDKTQREIFFSNVGGKAGTGVGSLASTNHVLAIEAGLYLRDYMMIKGTPIETLRGIKFLDDKGNPYADEGGDFAYRLDKIIGFTGKRISQVISYIQSAAVDNAKEQILGKLNLNMNTFGPAFLIARLGFDERFIGYFLSQPILHEYVQKVSSLGDSINQASSFAAKDQTITSLIEKYRKLVNPDFEVPNEVKSFSLKDMKALLEESVAEVQTPEYYKNQIDILRTFAEMDTLASDLRTVASAINAETTGVGKSLIEAGDKVNRVNKLINNPGTTSVGNVRNLFGETIIGQMTMYGPVAAVGLYSELFPYNSRAYRTAVESIEDVIGRDLTVSELEDLMKEIKSYLFTNNKLGLTTNADKDRARLFFGTEEELPLGERIANYKRTPEGSQNFFLSRLLTEKPEVKGEPYLVKYQSSPENRATEELMATASLLEMLERGNETERQIARDLILYNYLSYDETAKAISFAQYIPVDYLRKIGFTEAIRKFSLNDEALLINFKRQFFQHNPYKAVKLNPTLSEVTGIIKDKKSSVPLMFTLPVIGTKDSRAKHLLVPTKDSILQYPEFFYLRDEQNKKAVLYEFKGFVKGEPAYAQVDLLGGFGFKEYNFETSNVKSKLSTNAAREANLTLDAVQEEVKALPEQTTVEAKDEIADIYGFREGGIEDIKRVLNSISEAGVNPYYAKLAKVLSKNVNQLSDWTLRNLNDSTAGGRTSYATKSIMINTSVHKDSISFEDTFLHEIIHALTTLKLEDTSNETVKSLNSLFIKYKNSLNQEENQKWAEMYEAFKRGEEIDEQWLSDNKHKYYPAYNMREFITMVMTDQKTQMFMSGERFNSVQSLLDRFIKLITDLLAGVNPSKDIEIAFKNILDLINKPLQESDDNINFSYPPEVNTRLKKRIFNKFFRPKGESKPVYPYRDKEEIVKKKVAQINKAVGEEIVKYGRYSFDKKNAPLAVVRFTDKADDLSLDQEIDLNPNFSRTTKTGVKSIDEYVKRWESQIAYLKGQKVKGDADRNAELERRILYLENAIQRAKEDKAISHIINIAEEQLDWVEKTLSGAVNPEMFKTLHNYISVYEDIANVIQIEGNTKLMEIMGLAHTLRKKLREKENEYLYSLASESLGKKVSKEDLLSGAEDTNVLTANLLDASNSRIPLVRMVAELLNKAVHLVNKHLSDFESKLDKRIAALREYQKSKGVAEKDMYNIFLQTKVGLDKQLEYTGNLVNRYRQEYYDELKRRKGTGKYFWKWYNENTDFTITKEQEAQFEKDKVAARLAYEEEYAEDPAMVERKMQEWMVTFSPYLYIDNIKSGKGFENKGKKGYKYMDKNPKKKWEDPQYNAIMADPKLKEFYEFYRHELKEAMSVLPENDNQANYLPEVRKSILEQYRANGTTGALKGLKLSMIEAITTEEDSAISYEEKDPITGQPIPRVPVYMIADKLKPEDKSYDLGRVLQLFKATSLNYEYKTAVEDKVLLAQRAIRELVEYETYTTEDGKTEYRRDKDGNLIAKKGGHKNTLTQSETAIKNILYSKARDVEGRTTRVLHAETDKDGKVIRKSLTGSKVADVIFSITQLKGMGFNIFSPVTNLLYGTVSNLIYSAGRQEFTEKQVFKAFGIMLNSTAKSVTLDKAKIKTAEKVAQLMERLDVLFEVNEMKYGRQERHKLTPYELQKRSEYFVQGQTMVAMLMNTKLDNGKSLWEGFDVDEDNNLVWNEKFGPNPLDEVDYEYKLKAKIQQTNKKIHGNYDPNSPIALKRKWWGRMLMQFRSWLPEAAASRIRKSYYDERLGREVKGRWNTYADVYGEMGLMGTLKALLNQEGLSETDAANMRKNFAELAFTAAVFGFGLLLSYIDDDDDESMSEAAFNFFYNQTIRVQADLTFFSSPDSAKKILRDPIPALKTVLDLKDVFDSLPGIILGEDEYSTGRRKGRSKFMKELAEVFPLINQPDRIEAYLSEQFD